LNASSFNFYSQLLPSLTGLAPFPLSAYRICSSSHHNFSHTQTLPHPAYNLVLSQENTFLFQISLISSTQQT
jgi:hypothetical protein